MEPPLSQGMPVHVRRKVSLGLIPREITFGKGQKKKKFSGRNGAKKLRKMEPVISNAIRKPIIIQGILWIK